MSVEQACNDIERQIVSSHPTRIPLTPDHTQYLDNLLAAVVEDGVTFGATLAGR